MNAASTVVERLLEVWNEKRQLLEMRLKEVKARIRDLEAVKKEIEANEQ